jgi:hypothetical protein
MPSFGEQLCPLIRIAYSVGLVSLTPYRVLLHPFFAAVTLLLNNLIRSPASRQAQSDLHIVEPFLRLLETLAGDERRCSQSEEARHMYEICSDLDSRAKVAVEGMGMIIAFG